MSNINGPSLSESNLMAHFHSEVKNITRSGAEAIVRDLIKSRDSAITYKPSVARKALGDNFNTLSVVRQNQRIYMVASQIYREKKRLRPLDDLFNLALRSTPEHLKPRKKEKLLQLFPLAECFSTNESIAEICRDILSQDNTPAASPQMTIMLTPPDMPTITLIPPAAAATPRSPRPLSARSLSPVPGTSTNSSTPTSTSSSSTSSSSSSTTSSTSPSSSEGTNVVQERVIYVPIRLAISDPVRETAVAHIIESRVSTLRISSMACNDIKAEIITKVNRWLADPNNSGQISDSKVDEIIAEVMRSHERFSQVEARWNEITNLILFYLKNQTSIPDGEHASISRSVGNAICHKYNDEYQGYLSISFLEVIALCRSCIERSLSTGTQASA